MKRNRRQIITAFVLLALSIFLCVFLYSLAQVQERGRRSSCISNMKFAGVSIALYRQEHDQAMPTNLFDLVEYYGGDDLGPQFMCPSRNRKLQVKLPRRFSDLRASPEYAGYDYLTVTSSIPDRRIGETVLPVICDKPGNHGKAYITILYADGHAGWWDGTIESYAASKGLTITVNTNWLR